MAASSAPVPIAQLDDLGFAVVDVETTSAQPRAARVIELAVVHCDAAGRRSWAWHTLVDPRAEIPNTEHHGISAADVDGAPTLDEVVDTLVAALDGRVMVAHNIGFDHEVLRHELARRGRQLPAVPRLCTMRMARDLALEVPDHRLATLLAHLDLSGGLAHSALHDTAATCALFASLVELYRRRHVPETTAWAGPGPLTSAAPPPPPDSPISVARDGLGLEDLTNFVQRASEPALARFARSEDEARAAREQERLCPRCEIGHLVTRTRRRDGARFLGCSRFPDCRYSEPG